MQPSAGELGQRDVAADHDLFRRPGHALQAEPQRMQALVHHAALNKVGRLRMMQQHAVEHAGVLQCPTHHLRRGDRAFAIRQCDGAAVDDLRDLGEFLALASFRDRADRHDAGHASPLRLQHNQFGRGAGVHRRIGLAKSPDHGEAAGDCCGRRGRDCLVFLEARLAGANAGVDQPGTHDQPGCVDRLVSRSICGIDGGNRAAIKE